MSLKSEAARRRHYDYLLSRMIWETIVVTLLAILTGEIFEFLRCKFDCLSCLCLNGVNFPSLLITAFLTVICNLLVIYGLRSWKVFYVNFGLIHCITAGLYFFILTIIWGIRIINHKDFEKDGPYLMALIGLDIWLFIGRIDIEIQRGNMLAYPKPVSDNQIVCKQFGYKIV